MSLGLKLFGGDPKNQIVLYQSEQKSETRPERKNSHPKNPNPYRKGAHECETGQRLLLPTYTSFLFVLLGTRSSTYGSKSSIDSTKFHLKILIKFVKFKDDKVELFAKSKTVLDPYDMIK